MKTKTFKTATDIRDYLADILGRAERGELSAREASGIAALARVQLRCVEIADDPERVVVAGSPEDPLAFVTKLGDRQEAAEHLKGAFGWKWNA
ncbi:MAG: hypothetical protein AB7V14_00590 [Kiritimatiellia bacterium]